MTDDSTLGGYVEKHGRPPAFEGSDGRAYSVAVFVDDAPDSSGRFGAALLFVQWTPTGDAPSGHLETDYLAQAGTPTEAEAWVRRLSLHDVKAHLEQLIANQQERPH